MGWSGGGLGRVPGSVQVAATDAELPLIRIAAALRRAMRLSRVADGDRTERGMNPPRLHVETAGAGPTIVLAHGFAGSARNFGPQSRALRDRFRVVRYDARGHARSEVPSDAAAYTPDTFADDMGRVFDGTAVVGGLAMGAAVALPFALARPERVRGLVLAAYPAGRESGEGISSHWMELADAIERDGLEAAGARFIWGPKSGLDAAAARLVRQG